MLWFCLVLLYKMGSVASDTKYTTHVEFLCRRKLNVTPGWVSRVATSHPTQTNCRHLEKGTDATMTPSKYSSWLYHETKYEKRCEGKKKADAAPDDINEILKNCLKKRKKKHIYEDL